MESEVVLAISTRFVRPELPPMEAPITTLERDATSSSPFSILDITFDKS